MQISLIIHGGVKVLGDNKLIITEEQYACIHRTNCDMQHKVRTKCRKHMTQDKIYLIKSELIC